MSTVLLLAILLNVLLGTLIVYLSLKDEKKDKKIQKQTRDLIRKNYEFSMLAQVSERLGYLHTIKNVAEGIAYSVENLFEVTTVSFALKNSDTVTLQTLVRQSVSKKYLDQAKQNLLSSLSQIEGTPHEYKLIEYDPQGNPVTSSKDLINIVILSFFHVPLVVNGVFQGLISITSQKKDAFSEEDMVAVYQIAARATNTLGRLEKVISAEKEKLDSLILSLPSGAMLFLVRNGNLKLSTINSAAKDFLKIYEGADTYSVMANLGMNTAIIAQIKDVLVGKKSIFLKEVKVHDRFFKIFINPVFFQESDSAIGISITMHDITAEKEIELVKENFTNMVVHELRAPLVSIKGVSELLLKGNLAKTDEEKLLHIMKDQTERMLSDIGDLLDAAKIESGHFSIQTEAANMNRIIKDSIDAFSYIAKEKNIVITFTQQESLPEFSFDNVRIRQVINNLISNAIKFTQAQGTITIKATKEDGFAKVSIHDTGIGIPAEKIPLLFSKYGQIHNLLKKDGTGLGLYISKGIIESHGGKIWLESLEGKGATVVFTLPLFSPVRISQTPASFSKTSLAVN